MVDVRTTRRPTADRRPPKLRDIGLQQVLQPGQAQVPSRMGRANLSRGQPIEKTEGSCWLRLDDALHPTLPAHFAPQW